MFIKYHVMYLNVCVELLEKRAGVRKSAESILCVSLSLTLKCLVYQPRRITE